MEMTVGGQLAAEDDSNNNGWLVVASGRPIASGQAAAADGVRWWAPGDNKGILVFILQKIFPSYKKVGFS